MPSEASAEEGCPMRYVYLLESESEIGQRYVGVTSDLKLRLADHNAGKSPHTSKYVPWKLVTYVAFSDEQKAEPFEHYLKSGSGHAFAKKRLW
jgi:putative endonuclease